MMLGLSCGRDWVRSMEEGPAGGYLDEGRPMGVVLNGDSSCQVGNRSCKGNGPVEYCVYIFRNKETRVEMV